MIASSANIIHLVMRSTPFRSPSEHTANPAATTISIHRVMVPGSPSMPWNAWPTPAGSSPESPPVKKR